MICTICKTDRLSSSFIGRKKYCKLCNVVANNSEEDNQIELFKMIKEDSQLSKLPIFHVPNGAKRDKGTAWQLKQAGALKGVWDILGLFPNKNYHGFMIEMKAYKGKLSESQEAFQMMVNPNPLVKFYKVGVFVHPKQAFEFIKEYVNE